MPAADAEFPIFDQVLADIGDYDEMNRAYAEYFPLSPPARETVAVSGIVSGARVEISLMAVRTSAPPEPR